MYGDRIQKMRIEDLPKLPAMAILEKLVGGLPPEYGVSLYSVGFEGAIRQMIKDQVDTLITCGDGFFKLIIAPWGNGKTHFMREFREKMMEYKNGFACSFLEINPGAEKNLLNLDYVFREIIEKLEFPKSQKEIEEIIQRKSDFVETRGLVNALEFWIQQKKMSMKDDEFKGFIKITKNKILNDKKMTSVFKQAINHVIAGTVSNDLHTLDNIKSFFNGSLDKQKAPQYGLYDKITPSNYQLYLRSLSSLMKVLGFEGLVIGIDEAEIGTMKISDGKRLNVSIILTSIFNWVNSDLGNTVFLIAVTNESQVNQHGALKGRLETPYDANNPLGVKIDVSHMMNDDTDEIWRETLKQIGKKILKIYEIGYEVKLDNTIVNESLNNISDAALEFKRGLNANRRAFIMKWITCLNLIKRNPNKSIDEEKAKEIFSNRKSDESDNISESNFSNEFQS